MSGSFNQRRVAEIIRASQADWGQGYDLGKKRQGCGNRSLDTFSRAFREGYRRGYDESLGKKPSAIKQAPPRMSPEEESRVQAERGAYMAKRHEYQAISDDVLTKCHPAFREAYMQTAREILDEDDFRDPAFEKWLDEEADEAGAPHYG